MSHGDADSPDGELEAMWTIVVAGGSGLRFGGRKQFADLDGRSVLQRSVDASGAVSVGVVIVVPDDVVDEVARNVTVRTTCALLVVAGGSTRAESVRAGLSSLPSSATHILVHDAARPLASPELFIAVCDSLTKGAAAVVPVIGVADTIRRRDGAPVDRDELLAVQTPQGFRASSLRAAHEAGGEATDDATLVEEMGVDVVLIDGEPHNRKLTNPVDLITAAAIIDHLQERP